MRFERAGGAPGASRARGFPCPCQSRISESELGRAVSVHAEASLLRAQTPTRRSRGGIGKIYDPDESDIDKTRERSKRRLRLNDEKSRSQKKNEFASLAEFFNRGWAVPCDTCSKRWYGGRSHECFKEALAQPRIMGHTRIPCCHVVSQACVFGLLARLMCCGRPMTVKIE